MPSLMRSYVVEKCDPLCGFQRWLRWGFQSAWKHLRILCYSVAVQPCILMAMRPNVDIDAFISRQRGALFRTIARWAVDIFLGSSI